MGGSTDFRWQILRYNSECPPAALVKRGVAIEGDIALEKRYLLRQGRRKKHHIIPIDSDNEPKP